MDEAVTWWMAATPEQRREFLGEIGAGYCVHLGWSVPVNADYVPLPPPRAEADQVVDQQAPAPEPAPVKDVPVKVKTFTVELDEDDMKDVRCALDTRRDFIAGTPEGASCPDGALLAEICRGWLEMLEISFGKHPHWSR